jgi:hypothetical protein
VHDESPPPEPARAGARSDGTDDADRGVGSPASPALSAGIRAALRDPVVVILALAGIFDGLSGNPIHSVLLLGTSVALGREPFRARVHGATGSGEMQGGAPRGPADEHVATAFRLVAAPLVLVAIIAYSVVVGGFARYSWPATVSVLLPGVVVLWISWRLPSRPSSDPGPIGSVGVVAWVSVFVGAAIWELITLLQQPSLSSPSYAHPTLSTLTDPILASHPGRAIGLILWLSLGWFLVRR